MSNPFSANALPRRPSRSSPSADGLAGPSTSGSTGSGRVGGEKLRAAARGPTNSAGTGASGMGSRRSPDRWSPLSSEDGFSTFRSDSKCQSSRRPSGSAIDVGDAKPKKPTSGYMRRPTPPTAPRGVQGAASSAAAPALPPATPDFGAEAVFDIWSKAHPDNLPTNGFARPEGDPGKLSPYSACKNCEELFHEDARFCGRCGAERPGADGPGADEDDSDAMSLDLTDLREDMPGSAEMRRRSSQLWYQYERRNSRDRARTRTLDLTSAREVGSAASTDDQWQGSAPSTHDTDETQLNAQDTEGLVGMSVELYDAQRQIERQTQRIRELEMAAACKTSPSDTFGETFGWQQNLTSELQTSRAEVEAMREELKAARRELASAATCGAAESAEALQFRNETEVCVQLRAELGSSDFELDMCKDDLREMREELQQRDALLAGARQELHAELRSRALRLDSSQSDLIKLQHELEETQKQARDVELRSRTQTDHSLVALETELRTCEMQLDVFCKAKDAAQNARIEAEHLLWAAETERRTTGDQITKLEGSLLAMRSELKEVRSQAQREHENLTAQLEWRNEEIDGYSRDLADAREELSDALAAKAAEEQRYRDAHVMHEVQQRADAFKEEQCIKDLFARSENASVPLLEEIAYWRRDCETAQAQCRVRDLTINEHCAALEEKQNELECEQEHCRRIVEEGRSHLARANAKFDVERLQYDDKLRKQCEDLCLEQNAMEDMKRQHRVEMLRCKEDIQSTQECSSKATEEEREHLSRVRARFEAEQIAYDTRLKRQTEDLIAAQDQLVEMKRQHEAGLRKCAKDLRSAESATAAMESQFEAEQKVALQTVATLRIAEGAEAAKIQVAVQRRDVAVEKAEHALHEVKVYREEAGALRAAVAKANACERLQAETLQEEAAAAAEASIVNERCSLTEKHAEQVAEQRRRELIEVKSELRQLEKQLSDGEQRAEVHAAFLEQRLADNDKQMDQLREQGINSEAEVILLRKQVSASERACSETRGEVATWRAMSQEAQARSDEANEKVLAEVSKRAGEAREMQKVQDKAYHALRERASVECEVHEALAALTAVKRELHNMREKEWRTGAAFAAMDQLQQELQDSEQREEETQKELVEVSIRAAQLPEAQAEVQLAQAEIFSLQEEVGAGGPALAVLPGLEMELEEARRTMSVTWWELRSAQGAQLEASDACEALVQANEELGVVLHQRREAMEDADEAWRQEGRVGEQRDAATARCQDAAEEAAASLFQVKEVVEHEEMQSDALKRSQAAEHREEIHASRLLSELNASSREASAAQELDAELQAALAKQNMLSDNVAQLQRLREEDAARFWNFEEQEDHERTSMARLHGQACIESFCRKEEMHREIEEAQDDAAKAWVAANRLELEKRSLLHVAATGYRGEAMDQLPVVDALMLLRHSAHAGTGEAMVQPPDIDELPTTTKLQPASWMDKPQAVQQGESQAATSPDLILPSSVEEIGSPMFRLEEQRGHCPSAVTSSFEFSSAAATSHMQKQLHRGRDAIATAMSPDEIVGAKPVLAPTDELGEARWQECRGARSFSGVSTALPHEGADASPPELRESALGDDGRSFLAKYFREKAHSDSPGEFESLDALSPLPLPRGGLMAPTVESGAATAVTQVPSQSDGARPSSCASSPVADSVFASEVSTFVAAAAVEAHQVLRDLAGAKGYVGVSNEVNSFHPPTSEPAKATNSSSAEVPRSAVPNGQALSSRPEGLIGAHTVSASRRRLPENSWPLPWPPPPMLPAGMTATLPLATSLTPAGGKPSSLTRHGGLEVLVETRGPSAGLAESGHPMRLASRLNLLA